MTKKNCRCCHYYHCYRYYRCSPPISPSAFPSISPSTSLSQFAWPLCLLICPPLCRPALAFAMMRCPSCVPTIRACVARESPPPPLILARCVRSRTLATRVLSSYSSSVVSFGCLIRSPLRLPLTLALPAQEPLQLASTSTSTLVFAPYLVFLLIHLVPHLPHLPLPPLSHPHPSPPPSWVHRPPLCASGRRPTPS